jgi:hypothetical protein
MHIRAFLQTFETCERCGARFNERPLIRLRFFNWRARRETDGVPTGWAFAAIKAEFSTELSTGRLRNGKTST